MAKTKVGGANGLIDRLIALVGYQASGNPADKQRIAALRALDAAEKALSQADAMKYLETRASVDLPNTARSVALPDTMDYGKDFTLWTPDGRGRVGIVPADEFTPSSSSTYDAIGAEPLRAMIAIDAADGKMKFWFDRANMTGGALTYPLLHQRIVANLVDDVACESLVPEGYEITLLLPVAEEFVRLRRTDPATGALSAQLQARIAAFYDKFRANKKDAVTDSNLQRRKAETDVLATVAR